MPASSQCSSSLLCLCGELLLLVPVRRTELGEAGGTAVGEILPSIPAVLALDDND